MLKKIMFGLVGALSVMLQAATTFEDPGIADWTYEGNVFTFIVPRLSGGITTVSAPLDSAPAAVLAVTEIGANAIKDFSSYWTFTVPKAIVSIDPTAFDDAAQLKGIVVQLGNTNYWSNGSVLFTANKKTLVRHPRNGAGEKDTLIKAKSFYWKDSKNGILVESVAEGAFRGCARFKAAEIPAAVTNIGANAFAETGITNFVFSGGTNLTVGANAFPFGAHLTYSPEYAAEWESVLDANGMWNGLTTNTSFEVFYELNGGENHENNPSVYPIGASKTLQDPSRVGYNFTGWTPTNAITPDMLGPQVFTANWEVASYTITYTNLNGAVNAPANPEHYTITNDTIILVSPESTPNGYTFGSWSPTNAIPSGSFGDKIFTAVWDPISYAVDYDLVHEGAKNDGNPTNYTVETGVTLDYTPTCRGYKFVAWLPTNALPVGTYGDVVFTAKWEEVSYEICDVGRYLGFDLVKDFKIEIGSTNVDYAAGDKVTIKVEGLAKGLKLVATQQKGTVGGKTVVTNVVYTLEGVPTETVDFEKQPMYARVTVTYKDKGKTIDGTGKEETLQSIPLAIVDQDVRTLKAGVLNEDYGSYDIEALWPDVKDVKVNPKDWAFKTWPAGISLKDGLVFGKPTKAGEYPITATHKRKLSDGKTTVSETYSAVLAVWGNEGERSFRYTDRAYVATEPKVLGTTVAGVSGQPAGIKFDKATFTLSGTPTKPGVYATTLTYSDKTKATFLWKVAEGINEGFLSSMDWVVTNSAVKVMQGVIQTNWTCNLPTDAKVSANLPAGLKLVQDKTTGEWSLSGTATKEGNYVVTFKTVRNGVTVTERVSIVVEPNEWTGTWYAVQRDEQDASLMGVVTASANGTVKFVFTEGTTNYSAKGVASQVTKTTATAKNLDADGKTATIVLPRNKKDSASFDRTCVIDFGNKYVKIDGDTEMSLFVKETTDDYSSGYWSEVTTIVAEEQGAETNAYAYVTATFDVKKRSFKLQGKLWDGTAISATADMILSGIGPATAPILVVDKAKNAVLMLFACDEFGRVAASFAENGHAVSIGDNGYDPWSKQFSASDLKSKKFGQLTEDDQLVVLLPDDAIGTIASTKELLLDVSDKTQGTAVSAQGLVKFTLTDTNGWQWVCELLPIDNATLTQFRGVATGTKKGEASVYCSVWSAPAE